jgi:hypothetical protein
MSALDQKQTKCPLCAKSRHSAGGYSITSSASNCIGTQESGTGCDKAKPSGAGATPTALLFLRSSLNTKSAREA